MEIKLKKKKLAIGVDIGGGHHTIAIVDVNANKIVDGSRRDPWDHLGNNGNPCETLESHSQRIPWEPMGHPKKTKKNN